MTEYVRGSALEPVGNGVKLIAHIVNDAGYWNAGFVRQMSDKWPTTRQSYMRRSALGIKLGDVWTVWVTGMTVVANMVAQAGVRSSTNPFPLRFQAVENCLNTVSDLATTYGASVHMPRIGTGFAGGKWEDVEPIINRTLVRAKIPVTVYDP